MISLSCLYNPFPLHVRVIPSSEMSIVVKHWNTDSACFLNPAIIHSGFYWCHKSFKGTEKSAFLTFLTFWHVNCPTMGSQVLFIWLNTPRSRGCRGWIVCGGIFNMCTLLTASLHKWFGTCAAAALIWQEEVTEERSFSNSPQRFSYLSIHYLWTCIMSLVDLQGCGMVTLTLPLYIMYSRSNWPEAEMQVWTVISCPEPRIIV